MISTFLGDYEIYELVNCIALLIGIIFGAVAQKTQFCFSGSIKDYLLFSSTRRASSVIMAMIVAILGTYILGEYFEVAFSESLWRKEGINYFSIIIGGVLFGVGMVIADGCSSRHLVKFAQGDNKSLVTLLFIAIFAYASMKGILSPFVYALSTNETLLSLSSLLDNDALPIVFVLGILLIILALLVRRPKRVLLLYDGVIVGLLVTLGWYITWIFSEASLELGTQYVPFTSLTFVGPSARTLELFTHYKSTDTDFGILLLLGVLAGAFVMSRFNRKYSFGCVSGLKIHKLKNNMIGGALMGVGGVLALGCTVGQGLTGLSTLAIASFVAILSIAISGYIMALYLNKKKQLPMCFTFEWGDEKR
ncbi:MAG: hypothetical protein COB07_12295 [Sulfurovum sp.]|nr:MAG: hypothetical protein COB07_12295 [Sulfurovum sp.]